MKVVLGWMALGCAVAWSSLAVAQTQAQNAATACDNQGEPMPYTTERTDQVMQLQLSVIGLSLDETAVPPISADASVVRMRRETVGAVSQALTSVALVHFCRLEQAFPARQEEIEVAERQFIEDVSDAFDPGNFESGAALNAARSDLQGKEKPTFRVPQANLNNALVTEQFTRMDMTQVSAGVNILGFANARGCGAWVQRSAAQAAGVFLVALADAKPIIVRYLTSDTQTGTARSLLLTHARAAYNSAHANQIVQSMTPALTTCLTETAQHASDVLPPAPEAPPAPANNAAPTAPTAPADTAAPTAPTAPTAPATAPAVPR